MDPSEWGPDLWKSIHRIAAKANTKEKRDALNETMHGLKKCLPCDNCSINLAKNLSSIKYSEYSSSAERVLYWTYLLHDAVNREWTKKNPSKPKYSPPFELVRETYIKEDCGINCEVKVEEVVSKSLKEDVTSSKARMGGFDSDSAAGSSRSVIAKGYTSKDRKLHRSSHPEPRFRSQHSPVRPKVETKAPTLVRVGGSEKDDTARDSRSSYYADPRSSDPRGADYHMTSKAELPVAIKQVKHLAHQTGTKFVAKR